MEILLIESAFNLKRRKGKLLKFPPYYCPKKFLLAVGKTPSLIPHAAPLDVSVRHLGAIRLCEKP